MERENIKVTTPVTKTEVTLKSWITADERRQVTKALLDDIEYADDMKVKPKISGDAVNKSQDATIKAVVVSVKQDGKLAEDVLKTVLNLPTKDFDFVINEINTITGTGETTAKK